ncbi:MAG: electron transport complex subunit RsxE [Zetaproteobacteria bacterium CG_4_9_14_3_um_filter_49_83]|nr:MAG: electron transport complex subunit RsxE [Zetaproteobacteria bacterium CG1_02_49_23]PIQ30365.1 MAG: electron transport complex subunit RsxE [Zetaproteobacteria bacterium CG17_big_fil_post_rev_8_21_14_2_50_50_13]PIY54729.1 MAG: electron transport complex subunit RsxE [Zetaproteobacteria bacterium CG_4_10_14_0_8_um_filter_49_80]PJA34118.1 MAG: electron transport complex subunit RsxE [Zetaproteobacteria bacterium CG_4_9_14_3_um_filter_49_83]
MTDYRQIMRDGIWDNNVVTVQMLALCPLLAVTSTATNGLGMGLATTAVMLSSNLLISLLRNIISNEVRIPVFILLIASIVTLVDMSMNAFLHDLHKVLGLFIPLIVTNCCILARAESFASKQKPLPAVVDGLMMGAGFTLILVVLGGVREIIGSGTLFSHAALLLGNGFSFLDITLLENYRGFLLMILPSGGFLALGFLLAGKRWLDFRKQDRDEARARADTIASINAMSDEEFMQERGVG